MSEINIKITRENRLQENNSDMGHKSRRMLYTRSAECYTMTSTQKEILGFELDSYGGRRCFGFLTGPQYCQIQGI